MDMITNVAAEIGSIPQEQGGTTADYPISIFGRRPVIVYLTTRSST